MQEVTLVSVSATLEPLSRRDWQCSHNVRPVRTGMFKGHRGHNSLSLTPPAAPSAAPSDSTAAAVWATGCRILSAICPHLFASALIPLLF